jgi:hypothetical protein
VKDGVAGMSGRKIHKMSEADGGGSHERCVKDLCFSVGSHCRG